jgi:basic membrane protein A
MGSASLHRGARRRETALGGGIKTTAVLAAAALALTACGSGASTGADKKTVKVGLAYDIGGRGDRSFNDAAFAGLEKVESDLDVQTKDLSAKENEPDSDKEERLRLLAGAGFDPIIAVGFAYVGPLTTVAREFPDVKFAIIDGEVSGAPNVASLIFAEEQGSFLVGAAAALESRTGKVGFVGGCRVPLIGKFDAGFTAGAKAVDPAITVQSRYLSTTAQKCSGFNDPAGAKTTAAGMYEQGADIVFQAAGGSGGGVFQAAKAAGGRAIGVDSDQYLKAEPAVRDVILTSMIKRVDVAVFDFVKGEADGKFTPGVELFDLKAGGVGYSTSGGQIDDIKPRLDAYARQIIDGKITVPTTPAAS